MKIYKQLIILAPMVSFASAQTTLDVANPSNWDSTTYNSIGGNEYSPAYGYIDNLSFNNIGDSYKVNWNFQEGGGASANQFNFETRLIDNDTPVSSMHSAVIWNRSSDTLWLYNNSNSDGTTTYAPTQYLTTAPAGSQHYESYVQITWIGGSQYSYDHYLKNITTNSIIVDTTDSNSATGTQIIQDNPGFNRTDFSLTSGAVTSKSTVIFTPVPEPSSTALLGLGCIAYLLRRKK